MDDPIFELEDLIDEYMDRFEENFPTYMVKHLDTDEKIRIIRGCLDSGLPYEADDLPDGAIV